MPPWSYTNPMWRDAMREVISMLEGEQGDEAAKMRAEAEERALAFEGWLTAGQQPTDEERKAAVSAVTSLYKRARDLLRQRAEELRPRESSPSHP